MSKYIDAEKLIAEIDSILSACTKQTHTGVYNTCHRIKGIINSLQQEQLDIEKIKREWYNKGYLEGRKNAHVPARELGLPKSWDFQQEQPKVDLVAELKHHLATTPKEQLEKEWKELEPWNNIGPTVQEFLYGKQSEVDLEKEYKEYVEDDPVFSILTNRNVGLTIARHFFNLGLNARNEE